MKTNIKIFYIIAVLFLGMSCNQKDFLTEENPNGLTSKSFWKTRKDAISAVNAVYSGLQQDGVYGTGQINFNQLTDISRAKVEWGPATLPFMTMTFDATLPAIQNPWSHNYVGVNLANNFMQNIERVEMDEESKTLLIAQVRMLRAIYYYHLFQCFNNGSIVLRKTVPQTEEEFNQGLAPREEVFEFIMEDLTFAQENLPDAWTNDEDKGRVTKHVANAFKGKMYLNEKMWVESATEYKKIIDSGLYSLVDHPFKNFSGDPAYEYNSESIFEVGYNFKLNPVEWAGGFTNNDSEGNGKDSHYSANNGGGWRTTQPSEHLTLMYMNEMHQRDTLYEGYDVPPFNNKTRHSLRTQASIQIWDDRLPYYDLSVEDVIEKVSFNNGEVAYVKKMTPWYTGEKISRGIRHGSDINERVIRLAGVYLEYSEALMEIDPNGNLAIARGLVNLIRKRSGLVPLEEAKPAIANDPQKFFDYMRQTESAVELAFEGYNRRWIDLRRWGMIKDYFLDDVSQRQYVYVERRWLGLATQELIQAQSEGKLCLNVPKEGQNFIGKDIWPNGELVDCGSGDLIIPDPSVVIGEMKQTWTIADDVHRPGKFNYSPALHDYLPIPIVETRTNRKIN